MLRAALLMAGLAIAVSAMASQHCSTTLAFAPHAGLPLKGRSIHSASSMLSLRSSRPAAASISMASPFNFRQRVKKLMEKCKKSVHGVAVAAAATACVSVVTPPRPVNAGAPAATLAATETTTEATPASAAAPAATAAKAPALAKAPAAVKKGAAPAAATADDDELHLELEEPEEIEVEFTGRRKLTAYESIAKYAILGGVFGATLIYTVMEGKREDREEEERVTKEVERIEQWKKEFIDMDDVVADDDIMESLNKRLSGEGEDTDRGEDGSGGLPRGYNPDSDGDDGSSGGAEVEADNIISSDSAKLDQLRRMMGGDGK